MGKVNKMIGLWNEWEIRALVLLSLLSQVILIAFGSKRKTSTSTLIKALVWSAYLLADSVATTTLGILVRSVEDNPPLHSFWAPFLMLHLGGPDTITAYSLEDNEFWLRHTFGSLLNASLATSVFVRSWLTGDSTKLLCVAIPVFIVGFIKYGERCWALKFSDDFGVLLMDNEAYDQFQDREDYLGPVHSLFERLKFLFAEVVVAGNQGNQCEAMTGSLKSTEAFQVVEFELGLLYDLLYTKAREVYSNIGIFLRCVTCLASVSALVAFSTIGKEHSLLADILTRGKGRPLVDISISYILLVGAVVLEISALFMLISSDWLKLWLRKQTKLRIFLPRQKDKRWSRSIARFNLLSFCLKESTQWIKVQQLLGIYEMFTKHQNVKREKQVDEKLQNLIFDQLAGRSKESRVIPYEGLYKIVSNCRGNCVLNQMNYLEVDELRSSTIGAEFDESILLWHIATEICYHDDNQILAFETHNDESKNSRLLSDYMLYLLVMCPNMLPKGIGGIRFRNVCKDIITFFEGKRGIQIAEACKELLDYGDDSKILSNACKLARRLQNIKPPSERKEKWKMMEQVWVELLTYAAVHCEWKEHGQQLAKGGELLTHVCVLIANLDLSGQSLDDQLYNNQFPTEEFVELGHHISITESDVP